MFRGFLQLERAVNHLLCRGWTPWEYVDLDTGGSDLV